MAGPTRGGLAGGPVLPPESLRTRVHGSGSPESFLAVGRRCARDIEAALERTGRAMPECRRILDFGCGCGRTLLAFEGRYRRAQFWGTDIDIEAITWVRRSLPFVDADVNDARPPLRYPNSRFDLVYAISVFTHLDEAQQFLWLSELRRVVAPSGRLVVSVQGEHCLQFVPQFTAEQLRREGFLYRATDDWSGATGDHPQMAFVTEAYVRARYLPYFDIIDYVDRGLNDHQDLVVLRKRQGML